MQLHDNDQEILIDGIMLIKMLHNTRSQVKKKIKLIIQNEPGQHI